ncbi:MAG: XRE family transcriptional regulator, partial [Verrucomicrobiae bacterium]|nr:XRE family transcriptional regulator [Verrucomicrobiae bacterium]
MLPFCNIKGGVELRKLKALREGVSLSQERLGELAGVSRFAIMDYENGRSSPTFEMAKKLAVALGCSLSDLDDDCVNPPSAPVKPG